MIHLIDDLLDSVTIVNKKYVNCKEYDDTFAKTYAVLISEVESFIMDYMDSFLSGNWVKNRQMQWADI